MRKIFARWCARLAGGALVVASSLHAQTLSFRDVLQRPPIKADQRIAYGSDALQFGDLWLPSSKDHGAGPYPTVILIHGGCWRADLPGVELTHFMADDLRKSGFAVWEIEYRRVGHAGGGYPALFSMSPLAAIICARLPRNTRSISTA